MTNTSWRFKFQLIWYWKPMRSHQMGPLILHSVVHRLGPTTIWMTTGLSFGRKQTTYPMKRQSSSQIGIRMSFGSAGIPRQIQYIATQSSSTLDVTDLQFLTMVTMDCRSGQTMTEVDMSDLRKCLAGISPPLRPILASQYLRRFVSRRI